MAVQYSRFYWFHKGQISFIIHEKTLKSDIGDGEVVFVERHKRYTKRQKRILVWLYEGVI